MKTFINQVSYYDLTLSFVDLFLILHVSFFSSMYTSSLSLSSAHQNRTLEQRGRRTMFALRVASCTLTYLYIEYVIFAL